MPQAKRNVREVVQALKAFAPITLELVSNQLGTRGLAANDPRAPLTKSDAEAVQRVIAVLERATEVHKGARQAAIWCLQEIPALGRRTPIQACQTDEGYQRVLHLLGQIEHGIFG